jgi:tripartite-type tricarboxylate transporter receptor subunit TctC
MPPILPGLSRRSLLALSALALAGPAAAQPAGPPFRMIVGFPAGSGPDVLARLLAEALRDTLAGPVVVDNRPGAAGHIAAQEAARAAPDGQTAMLGEVGQLAMSPSTYARLPYDPARDFVPVAKIAAVPFLLVVPAALPVTDFRSYLAWARERRPVFFATFGAGTPGHFGAAILGLETGLVVEPVHFRTTGDAMSAILNGDAQGLFGSVALVAPHVAAGRLKALATTAGERLPAFPEVPSMAELGLPALVFESWFGLVAPAATPAPALARLEQAALRAMESADLRRRMAEAGFRPTPAGRAAFAEEIAAETRRWAEVVRRTGFRAIE